MLTETTDEFKVKILLSSIEVRVALLEKLDAFEEKVKFPKK